MQTVDTKPWYKSGWFLAIIIFLVIAIIVGVISGVILATNNDKDNSGDKIPPIILPDSGSEIDGIITSEDGNELFIKKTIEDLSIFNNEIEADEYGTSYSHEYGGSVEIILFAKEDQNEELVFDIALSGENIIRSGANYYSDGYTDCYSITYDSLYGEYQFVDVLKYGNVNHSVLTMRGTGINVSFWSYDDIGPESIYDSYMLEGDIHLTQNTRNQDRTETRSDNWKNVSEYSLIEDPTISNHDKESYSYTCEFDSDGNQISDSFNRVDYYTEDFIDFEHTEFLKRT